MSQSTKASLYATANSTIRPLMTIAEAKTILGTTAKGLSDDFILRLLTQVDILTDTVVAHVKDSIIKSPVENADDEVHNDE